MLIIPAIDLRDGRCVRLKQGRRDQVTHYDGDPVAVAKEFRNQGAQWLHLVDLDGAFAESNSKNRQTLKAIIDVLDIPIQFGGGLRSFANVEHVLKLGVARVVVGTMAIEQPDTLRALLDSFGSDPIAVSIDAKNGKVATRGWEKSEATDAIALAREMANLGVKRIVYTDVGRDGMLEGPNIDMTQTIARESGVSITASGGISSLADIQRLMRVEQTGVDSVIVGRALYENRFTLADAIRVATSEE